MDTEQEKELVEQAKQDITAFGSLYDTYYPRISGYVLKRTADIEISRDITAEVFFKALNNIHTYKWKGIPFSAWLYRIANNEIADHYRNNGHEKTGIDEVANSAAFSKPSPETVLIEAEEELRKYKDFLLVHQLLKQLSIRYQEVITLRYFEKKKIGEVASILGKREGTVKSLLHRGLEKLRILMEENEKPE